MSPSHDPNILCLERFKSLESKIEANTSTNTEITAKLSSIETIVSGVKSDHDLLIKTDSEIKNIKDVTTECCDTLDEVTTKVETLTGIQNVLIERLTAKEKKTEYYSGIWAIVISTIISSLVVAMLLYVFGKAFPETEKEPVKKISTE